jgi:hypothetical protein
MAKAPPETEKVAAILEKAIRGLPQRDQTTVVRYLLHSWLADPMEFTQPPGPLHRALRHAAPGLVEFAPASASFSIVEAGPAHQTLPVRLPEAQYARLKAWCSERGFSMATVIRGLVERFLESQGRA